MIDKYKLLISKIDDLILSVDKGKPSAFTSFLSFDDLTAVKVYISKRGISYREYGGFDDAERKVIAVLNTDKPNYLYFPIVALYFETARMPEVSHKDVLGALMSLGIKRELIGDIIFFDNKCIFFVIESISDFIIQNFISVKKYGVKLEIYVKDISYTRSFEEHILTLPSMRVDCIVSDLVCVSRTRSSEYIENGFVFVNGMECLKKDKELCEGDTLSIRKFGKFRIIEKCGYSKKGKIKLKILKYI